MTRFPTSKENIALNFIFEFMNEPRCNRTSDEYVKIAARLPCIESLHAYVSEQLRKIAASGVPAYEICRFRAGDQGYRYEPFPKSLSRETIRSALIVSGMSSPRTRQRRLTH